VSVPWVRVGDLLRLERRSVEIAPGGLYREIGVRSFGRGIFHKEPVSGAELGTKKVFKVEPGDLVVSNVFAWEGAVGCATDRERGRIGSHRFMTWVPECYDVDVRYVAHFLLSDSGMSQLRRASPGSAGRNRTLAIGGFRELRIPLPGLDDQRRIAARLDAIAAVSAETGATAQQLVESIEARLLADVITDAPTRRFGDLLHLERRKVDVALDAEYREVGVRSFGRGLFIKDPITGSELGGKRVFRVCSGDLVISNIFAWEGAVALATDGHDGLIGSHRFMTWVPSVPEVDPCFVRHYLTSPGGVAALRAASPGSAGRNRTLGISALSDLPIPIPDISLQQRVNARFVQSHRVRALWHRRSQLGSALLPAARNEEFSRLTSA